ncbi:MFS general substrate transporter [Agrocybe pediades]|nr:MFS general substrate transporter [Agrocybe pediades]
MTLAPRIEVFTQLSCNRLHGDHHWNHTQTALYPHESTLSLYSSLDPLGPHLHSSSTPFPPSTVQYNSNSSTTPSSNEEDRDRKDSDDTEDPRRIPSARCLGDPAVQAGAARLQTIMTTTMGFLSALTTGWWGHFGERHGRTRVLAISTFGLFLTDLTFILVSTPSSFLSRHGHNLLLIAPVIEGFLGGWSALQSAISAYLSDCTSPGSRAQIFSRFQGVLYVGFALGPSIGGWLIQHPLNSVSSRPGEKSVTLVFWVAIICSFVNFLLVLFVFPESLGKKKMEQAIKQAEADAARKGKMRVVDVASTCANSTVGREEDVAVVAASSSSDAEAPISEGIIMRFLRPLSVFLPVMVLDSSPNGIGHRKRRDWSLTMLALALFGFMLSTGLFQIKYLYAVHTYGWSAEQLGYYISFMGAGRAVWLLFLLPSLIAFFKPKPASQAEKTVGKKATNNPITTSTAVATTGKKPNPTRAQLGQEIKFDLALSRCSLCMDILSHSLVAIFPSPAHASGIAAVGLREVSYGKSEAMFVFASSLNGMGSGAVPAIHSLALCVMQVRALGASSGEPGEESTAMKNADEGTGQLFGALAVLQAVGQMILGPMLFGMIYGGTVAKFPKAIFVVGAGIMVFALVMLLCVRNPVRVTKEELLAEHGNKSKKGSSRRANGDVERGRSRISKDLRGGAVGYGSTGSSY